MLGHPRTVGEAIHITSDDVLTWNQIAESLAAALGVTARLVHVPSDAIAAADPEWGAGLLGDKAHSMVFDNAKLRSMLVFGSRQGIKGALLRRFGFSRMIRRRSRRTTAHC